jgi:hypothetical protein
VNNWNISLTNKAGVGLIKKWTQTVISEIAMHNWNISLPNKARRWINKKTGRANCDFKEKSFPTIF